MFPLSWKLMFHFFSYIHENTNTGQARYHEHEHEYIYMYMDSFFFGSNQYGPCGQYIFAGRYVSGIWRLIASVETMPCPDSIDITKYSVVMSDGQFMSYLRHILQGHIYLHYILPHIGISEALIWLDTPV